jgi:hypothetical protein
MKIIKFISSFFTRHKREPNKVKVEQVRKKTIVAGDCGLVSESKAVSGTTVDSFSINDAAIASVLWSDSPSSVSDCHSHSSYSYGSSDCGSSYDSGGSSSSFD